MENTPENPTPGMVPGQTPAQTSSTNPTTGQTPSANPAAQTSAPTPSPSGGAMSGASTPASSPSSAPEPEKKSSKLLWYLIGGIILILVILGIFYGLGMGGLFQGNTTAVNPLTTSVTKIAVVPGFSVAQQNGVSVDSSRLKIDVSKLSNKTVDVYMDDAVVRQNFRGAYLVSNTDYPGLIDALKVQYTVTGTMQQATMQSLTAKPLPQQSVTAVPFTQQTQQIYTMQSQPAAPLQYQTGTQQSYTMQMYTQQPSATLQPVISPSRVSQPVLLSPSNLQTNIFYDVAGAASLSNAIQCPQNGGGDNVYVSCDMSSALDGDYKLVFDLKDNTQQVVDITVSSSTVSCVDLSTKTVSFSPANLSFDRTDPKDNTQKQTAITTDLPDGCSDQLHFALVDTKNMDTNGAPKVVQSWASLDALKSSQFAIPGGNNPTLQFDSSAKAFNGGVLPAGDYDFKVFDNKSGNLLGHLPITVKDVPGAAVVDCTKIPTVQFTPSTVDKDKTNLKDNVTVSIDNFPPDQCQINPKMVNPDGKDISSNFVFDIQKDNSFVLNSPANAAKTSVIQRDVILNFAVYSTQFSQNGDYKLVLSNVSNKNAQIGSLTIHVDLTGAAQSPQTQPAGVATPSPSPTPAPAPSPSPAAPIKQQPEQTPPTTTSTTTTTTTAQTPATGQENVDCATLVGEANYTASTCALAQEMKAKGVITGALHPSDPLKRYEAALMVVRALGLGENCTSNILSRYRDVDISASYIPQLCAANNVGVIKGYTSDPAHPVMYPARQVTYREFSRMLVNGYVATGLAKVPRTYSEVAKALGFNVAPANDWFGFALQYLVNRGVVSLDELKSINLDASLTRLDVVELISNVMNDVETLK